MERMTKIKDLKESCIKKWENVLENILKQAESEAATSAKIRQAIDDKKGIIPGETEM